MTVSLKNSSEPALLISAVFAVLGWIADFLVTHGIITADRASSLVQSIAPSAIAVASMLAGLVIRRYVSPAWKLALREGAAAGIDLTAEPHVAELAAVLGLDVEGNPLPVPAVAAVPVPPATT